MKKILIFIAIFVFILTLTDRAGAKITMTTSGSMTYQGISSEDSRGRRGEEPSFVHPLVNFNVHGSFDDGVGLHAEVYAGERASAESDTGIDSFRIGEIYGTSGSWFDPLTFRGGKIEIPFGRNYLTRSDHGDVQRNPLVGNHLPDVHAQQLGGEVSLDYGMSTWSLAITNGTDQVQLNPSRGTAVTLGVLFRPLPDLSFNLSGYRVRHGDTTTDRASDELTTSNLFGTNQRVEQLRSITSLQTTDDDPYTGIPTGFGVSPDAFVVGRNVKAWQMDFSYELHSGLEMSVFYGQVDDDVDAANRSGSSSSSEIEWSYYSLQTTYEPVNSRLEFAARFGEMDAEALREVRTVGSGITRNGRTRRFQLGTNYQLTDNILLKAEFVRGYENITSRSLEYDGLVFEISAAGLPKLNPENLAGETKQKRNDN